MEKYKSRIETWIKERYDSYDDFAKEIGFCTSAVSKWVNGIAFPDPKAIRLMWGLTKDEIGPMYWYSEWPTEMRLRNESIRLLRTNKRTKRKGKK